MGNRLSSLTVPLLSYNSSNELVSTSRSSYTYDYNGNLLSKTSSSGTTSYAWDYENRLTSVTLPGSGGTVTFKYDPFGRRIQKSGPAGNTNYLYDGANAVTDLDANGAVLARYTQGSGVDEPLASITGVGTAFFEADGLGSITSLSGPSGLTDTYTYKPFGITTATGTNSNRFRYTGREWDQETGLYYYRARYYDPNVGRFISEDPARFYGGFNFYGYVKNNPVDFVDPTGLKCWQSSPWTEMPSVWGGNGPSPYLTIEDGLFWVPVGWSFAGLSRSACICRWMESHTRIRKFYRVPVTEQAQFTCDCGQTYYEERRRTKEYEVDSPGIGSWPPREFDSLGYTVQIGGDNVGAHPSVWKQTVTCLCRNSPPQP